MEKQPAEKSYVFDKGYRDVARAFSVTWGQTFDSDSIKRLFSNVVLLLPNLIVFLLITAFRIVLNTVISVLLVAVFLILAPFVYIGFVLVAFLDFLYRLFKRISSVCPNCQYRFDLPAYLCPKCKQKHSRLIPSRYGVFKRKCLCGQKLPTTFFNGRQKLQAMCNKCNNGLRDGGQHVEICIPVIGGVSAGKTCFVNTLISKIEDGAAVKAGFSFEYVLGTGNYRNIIQGMKQGFLPPKTNDMRLKYDQFYLTPKGESVKRLISLCDVGGEIYANDRLISEQIGFRYANAFIMVIDPLSVRAYRKEAQDTVDLAQNGASAMTIDAILNRLVVTLENLCNLSAKEMLKTDVAVVFTKADLPGLDALIGKTAVANYRQSHRVSEAEASSALCEAFLRQYEEDNFVHTLRSKFQSVQYFACSALGTSQQGKAFQAVGMEGPVNWLLERIRKNK